MFACRLILTRACLVALALAGSAVVDAGGSSSAAAATARSHISVYFLRGEQLARVQRPGRTPLDAMRQLVAGPTPAEVARGFRTYLPANTRVWGVKHANGGPTGDLNEPFASGGDNGSLLARLSQVVRTLTGLHGTKKVQLL